MNEPNPYAPPKARVADVDAAAGELAGRWERLGAALLDGLIGLVWGLPLAYAFGVFNSLGAAAALATQKRLELGIIGFVAFALVHGYFLNANGQTIGKKIVGMRIAMLDGSVPPLWRTLGLRYLPVTLVQLIPTVGGLLGLIDILLIFRDNRRCAHDLIAGTKVVKV